MYISWRGLPKLIEECGELVQAAAKLVAAPNGNFPDGIVTGKKHEYVTNLEEEIADVLSACEYVMLTNDLDHARIMQRKGMKLNKLNKWTMAGVIDEMDIE